MKRYLIVLIILIVLAALALLLGPCFLTTTDEPSEPGTVDSTG